MKKIIELSWLAFFKIIINAKKAFILVIILWIIALLIACGGTKKTTTQTSDFEQVLQSDSQYSHAKDYIDTTLTERDFSSDQSVVRYFRPIIFIDSLGRRTITADSVIEKNNKTQVKTKEKKGIRQTETTYIRKTFNIHTRQKFYITKTVVHKSKWLTWLIIGAALGIVLTRLAPQIFKFLKRLILPVPV